MPKCRTRKPSQDAAVDAPKPKRPRKRDPKPVGPPGRWEIWCPEWIPVSANVIIGHMGVGTGAKAKDKDYLSLFVGHVKPADRPRRMDVIYSYPKGTIGIDLSNGFKSIEDALSKLGVLWDDNRKWLNWISATSVEGPLGTRIVVTDEGWED